MRNLFQILIIFILFFTTLVFPQQVSKKDSILINGINQIYNIKFDDAAKIFNQYKLTYPNEAAGQFFLAMVDWWRILLNTTNEELDDKFLDELDNIIDKCDSILESKPNDIDALFYKGGAIGFKGRLYALRKSWLKAADEGRNAISIVKKVTKLKPDNYDIQLGIGMFNYYVSILPEKYSILKPFLLFMPKTDKNKGIQQVKKAASKGIYSKYEARYFLMIIYYSEEKKPIQSDQYARMLMNDFPNNPVFEKWGGRIAAKIGNSLRASKIFKDVYKKSNLKFKGYNNLFTKREAVYYIADEYWKENKIDSSKLYFEKSIKYSNQIEDDFGFGFYINSLLYMGMINDVLKNRVAAISYYNKILDLDEYLNSYSLAKKYIKTPFKK